MGVFWDPSSAYFEDRMSFKFLTATTTALSFCTLALFGAYGPASAVWASDVPTEVDADVGLVPSDVIDIAQDETDAEMQPIDGQDTVVDDEPRPQSLSDLVGRHRSSQTANREAECLAVAVYFESKGEPLDGQLAVARTVLNRTESGRFPSSICSVVMQRGQFSFVRGGALPSVPRASAMWKTAVAIGHIAQADLWNSSVSTALFFHARHVSPGWKMRRVASVGNHVFYR